MSSSRIVALALVCGIALVSGCKSTGELTHVERAKKITKHLNEGVRLMKDLSVVTDINNPRFHKKALRTMTKAEYHFREAVRLGSTSSKPRIGLGNCLQAIGMLHLRKYESLQRQIQEYKDSGDDPPEKLLQESRKSRVEYRQYFTQSNEVFAFYARNFMSSFPNAMVYEAMQRNFEWLEDWEQAVEAARTFLREMRLKGRDKLNQEKLIRIYEEKHLESIGENEDT